MIFSATGKVDQQAAESAGVRFVAYKSRNLGGDTFIDDHRDVLKLVSNNHLKH
jgi:hypothetical protein